MSDEVPSWNDPETQDDSWDTLLLGGQFMPGLSEVECEIESKLDVKKPKGADGATMTDEGLEPANVTIRTKLYNKADLDALTPMLPLLRPPRKGGPRDPLTIEHPNTAVFGVTAIAVKKLKVSQPDQVDGWLLEIDAVEWLPGPKATPAAAKGAKGSGGGSKPSCQQLAAEARAASERAAAAQYEYQSQAQRFQAGSGVLMKNSEAAALEQARKRAAQTSAEFDAAVARVNACGGKPPPSAKATENVL